MQCRDQIPKFSEGVLAQERQESLGILTFASPGPELGLTMMMASSAECVVRLRAQQAHMAGEMVGKSARSSDAGTRLAPGAMTYVVTSGFHASSFGNA